MLVLQRSIDETIVIDLRDVDLSRLKDIDKVLAVTLVAIRGSDKARIGLEVPKQIPVHRREVFDAIKRDGVRKQFEEVGKSTKSAKLEKLLAVVERVFNHLHDLPELTREGRELLEQATAALKVAEPHKWDAPEVRR